MNLFRIYTGPGRENFLCTACVDTDDPTEALEKAKENDWVRGQLSDGAWAEMAEEVGEW
jgi:hypothetical protein